MAKGELRVSASGITEATGIGTDVYNGPTHSIRQINRPTSIAGASPIVATKALHCLAVVFNREVPVGPQAISGKIPIALFGLRAVKVSG